MNTRGIKTLALTSGLMFAALAVGDPAIDITHSKIVATFREENVPVDGQFTRFGGSIHFDAANPAATHASIDVMTATLDVGSAESNDEVRKKSWLDVATFPHATFVSSSVRQVAPGKLEATGTLTLKGRTQTLVVPVAVSSVGPAKAYDGVFNISRKAFGIGDPQWNDEVDDTVRISFHLVD